MFKQGTLRKVERLIRRHWLVAMCVAGVVGVLWIGAPAWAAPVARPLNQTVPRPTPTDEGSPIATATPRPDDNNDANNGGSGSSGNSGSQVIVDPNSPNITFPVNPGGTSSDSLTALVNVTGLNLREGPGTNFNTLGNLPANTEITVLSRNEENTWWYICCIPGTDTKGWVSAQLLTPNFDVSQAATLIPLFGAAPAAIATPQPAAQAVPVATLPLELGFQLDPYFVWQGITATLTITVNNPNKVDAVNVLLSDELPAALTLISAEPDAGGTLETVTAASGQPLLLFRWTTIPADTAVTVTIVTLVSPNLANGEVIDNLVATRARNVAYHATSVTIGMPPIVPPVFQ